MSEAIVIQGGIRLVSYVDRETAEHVVSVAKLPSNMAADWEGQTLHLIDWKIDRDKKTVWLCYQTRNDVYAAVNECTLPLVVERLQIAPPNRSKHWEIENHSDNWINRKTGKRVHIFCPSGCY